MDVLSRPSVFQISLSSLLPYLLLPHGFVPMWSVSLRMCLLNHVPTFRTRFPILQFVSLSRTPILILVLCETMADNLHAFIWFKPVHKDATGFLLYTSNSEDFAHWTPILRLPISLFIQTVCFQIFHQLCHDVIVCACTATFLFMYKKCFLQQYIYNLLTHFPRFPLPFFPSLFCLEKALLQCNFGSVDVESDLDWLLDS